jgi:hypothetical protein
MVLQKLERLSNKQKNMNELTKLELHVMRMLLDGEDEVLANLRRQLDACKIVKREMTGVGFFTDFEIPADVPRATQKSFHLGDVNGTVEGAKHGVGFVLFIEAGTLKMLEGYTYDEPWPDSTESFELTYNKGQHDLDALKKLWS